MKNYKLSSVLEYYGLENKNEISLEELNLSGNGKICAEKMLNYCA